MPIQSLSVFSCRTNDYYRLSKAARLLKETNLTVSEIAIQTGFNGQSYFGKCFREKMNCAPSEYRKM